MVEYWVPVDSRSGRRVSAASWLSRESLEAAIEGWRVRDARGGRPDLRGLMPFVVAVRVEGQDDGLG